MLKAKTDKGSGSIHLNDINRIEAFREASGIFRQPHPSENPRIIIINPNGNREIKEPKGRADGTIVMSRYSFNLLDKEVINEKYLS